MLTLLKLGGELLEGALAMREVASAAAHLAAKGPLVIVHGG
jgi:acetylglutamate kinase